MCAFLHALFIFHQVVIDIYVCTPHFNWVKIYQRKEKIDINGSAQHLDTHKNIYNTCFPKIVGVT